MYKLFYANHSAAMGTRAVLEEIGADYELLDSSIDLDEPRPPELLALNPNGWVPVLIYDGGAMHEASAITVFLTDRHAEANLAPGADDPLRGPFLQWLVYLSNTLQMAYQLSYYPLRFCESEEHIASARARSCIRLREIWGMIDDAIGDDDWLVGNRFTAADIHVRMLATWLSPDMGHPTMQEFPNANRVVANAAVRPAVKKVFG
ncbi:MAG: glutathione S-transferase family protein [Pseudomonadota bacterium]